VLSALQRAERIVQHDMQELFFRVCGLNETHSDDATIEHGAAHISGGWGTPLTACMTYHRDVREFVRDFARIYLADRRRVFVPVTFGKAGDTIWELDEPNTLQVGEFDDFERQVRVGGYAEYVAYEDQSASINRFLDALDRPAAERLSNLSDNETRALLKQAVDETPLVWLEDFGEQGAVIGTRPFSDFRRLYPKIAALAGVIPET